jgi:hypothetical protein
MGMIINLKPMLTNFFLAIVLIAMAIGVIISLDTATSLMVRLVKTLLKVTRRSKLLTEYILRAYMRYRRAINKPIISNSY